MNSVDALVDSLREKLPSDELMQLEGRFSYPLNDPLEKLNGIYRAQNHLTRSQVNEIVQWKNRRERW